MALSTETMSKILIVTEGDVTVEMGVVDEIGQTTIPAAMLQHLPMILDEGIVCVAPDMNGRFLKLMSNARFVEMSRRVAALPRHPAADIFRRFVVANTERIEVTPRGDLTIPRILREGGGLKAGGGTVVWRAREDVVELWSLECFPTEDQPPSLEQELAAHSMIQHPQATLPSFVAGEVRTQVGPFALWSPASIGTLHRWWGVRRADPTVVLSVITFGADGEDYESGNEDLGDGASSGADDVIAEYDIASNVWRAARRAHLGLSLQDLMARNTSGVLPFDFLVAIARALTRGTRALRPVAGPADINIGIDGVITVDGLDELGLTRFQWWRGPTLEDAEACHALLSEVLSTIPDVDITALLHAVRATQTNSPAAEHGFVAGIVGGLAPDIVEREHNRVDELSLLNADSWHTWSTVYEAHLPPAVAAPPTSTTSAVSVLDERTIDQLRTFERDRLGEISDHFSLETTRLVDELEDAWREQRSSDTEHAARALRTLARETGTLHVWDVAVDIQQRSGSPYDTTTIEQLRAAIATASNALCVALRIAVRP
jgi:DNA-binding transcriptional regulator/RsmH inhibitor MraZ